MFCLSYKLMCKSRRLILLPVFHMKKHRLFKQVHLIKKGNQVCQSFERRPFWLSFSDVNHETWRWPAIQQNLDETHLFPVNPLLDGQDIQNSTQVVPMK